MEKVAAGDFIPLFTTALGRDLFMCWEAATQGLALMTWHMEPNTFTEKCLDPVSSQYCTIRPFLQALVRALLKPTGDADVKVSADAEAWALPAMITKGWKPRRSFPAFYLAVPAPGRTLDDIQSKIIYAGVIINHIAKEEEGATTLVSAGLATSLRAQPPLVSTVTAYRSLVANASSNAPGIEDLLGMGVVSWVMGLCCCEDKNIQNAAFGVLAALLPIANKEVREALHSAGLPTMLCTAAVTSPNDPKKLEDCSSAAENREAALLVLPHVSTFIRAMDIDDSLPLIVQVLSPGLYVMGGAALVAKLFAEGPDWAADLLNAEGHHARQHATTMPGIASSLVRLLFPKGADWSNLRKIHDRQLTETAKVRGLLKDNSF